MASRPSPSMPARSKPGAISTGAASPDAISTSRLPSKARRVSPLMCPPAASASIQSGLAEMKMSAGRAVLDLPGQRRAAGIGERDPRCRSRAAQPAAISSSAVFSDAAAKTVSAGRMGAARPEREHRRHGEAGGAAHGAEVHSASLRAFPFGWGTIGAPTGGRQALSLAPPRAPRPGTSLRPKEHR